jgi:pilus assembly protein CpaB
MRSEDTTTRTANGAKPRKRIVRAIALLALALFAAGITATLLTRYMDARTAAVRVPTVKVVAAAVAIPVAVPIKAEWLAVIDWPAASRPEGTEQAPAALVDRVPIVAIEKGEPVLAAKLAQPGTRGGLSALLPEGMRAVAVRVDDVVGVAGFIHPGDRVDVIATMQAKADEPTSKVILQNVKVLTVGKDVDEVRKDGAKAVSATVATLMVSPEESESLALAATKGKLLLALRGMGDAELADTNGATAPLLLAAANPPTPPQPAPPKSAQRVRRAAPKHAAAPTPPAAPKQTVEILRGDLFEKRDFAKAEGTR